MRGVLRSLALLALLLVLAPSPARAQQISPCNTTVDINALGVSTLLIAAPASISRVYVCFLVVGTSAAATVTIIEGTGASCGTNTLNIGHIVAAAASTAIPMGGSGVAIFSTQVRGNSLCVVNSAGTASGMLTIGFGP